MTEMELFMLGLKLLNQVGRVEVLSEEEAIHGL